MEVEFDKEIDAILRKTQDNRGVLVGDDPAEPKKHLDADVIAAFGENALPQKSKFLYMEHFADCDKCRRMLSQSILMNTEAEATAASVVSAPIVDSAATWFQGLFRTPNLAFVFGALVLAFGGVLGFLVLQNRNADSNARVSQVTEQREPSGGGPYYSGELDGNANSVSTAAANKPANSIAPVAGSGANSAPLSSNSAAMSPDGTSGGKLDSTKAVGSGRPVDGIAGRESDDKTAEPKPDTPAPIAQPITGRDDKEILTEKAKDEDIALASRKRAGEERSARDLPASAAKSGPARSGPIQNQTQTANNSFDMPVKRLVGGKTFNNRNGAWYDSAYRGQATSNYRRGTPEYNKLDGGLRSIANELGGVVVVVWKERAYRIQ